MTSSRRDVAAAQKNIDMKPLADMNNVEKAKLLHKLFPAEMPDLVDFIEGMAETTKEDGDLLRPNWNNPILSVDDWLNLAVQIGEAIKENKTKIAKSSNIFSDQLFEWLLALFTIHCVTTYTSVREHPNPKFTIAVNLLFNP
jgi:hypothetical protein